MNKLVKAAAALLISVTVGGPATAQDSLTQTFDTCSVVIDLQYNDDRSRDGQCVGAVSTWLDAIGAPSASADQQIADLVVKLTELYRDDADCKIAETELPLAIATAAGRVADEDIRAEYILISQQIEACDFEEPGAINDELPLDLDPGPNEGSPS